MPSAAIVLLPGLDGTSELFAPFLREIPRNCAARVVNYPEERALNYAELLDHVTRHLNGTEPFILVAESFSGPLALQYAADNPECVLAVVLCASFVRSPLSRAARWMLRAMRFRLPITRSGVKYALVGEFGAPGLVTGVISAIRRVSPPVLAARLRALATVDCGSALINCRAPLLYLRASHDRLVGHRSLQEIQRLRPDTTVRRIAAPHLVLQSAPAAAWREIAEFLARCNISLADCARP